MTQIPAHFQIPADPIASPDAIVRAPRVRFTVLSPGLVRMEYSPQEQYEDRPSQVFWFRRQPVPEHQVRQQGDTLEIETSCLVLRYTLNTPFSAETLTIELPGSGQTWHYGDTDAHNLLGTTRTLDNVDGQIALENGLLSRSGWTLVDDSRSLVFSPEGWLESRDAPAGTEDLYFFGYGKDFSACLADFHAVSGPTPVIPRWALGNWWSRYWAFSQQELTDLMLDFQKYELPLSVCIIDMDWHLTQTGNASSGWTGYTWNRALFPDPPAFLNFLHSLGLKTSLNLHPAEGIHPHEARYPEMARAVGIDPASKEPVSFVPTDPTFAMAYLENLHHPQEESGVDFWWMDWQQGNPSRLPGLNLLWWINHLHYYDSGRDGVKRPFLFSRWGGLGNHRYPIGFSGDTVITWDSLAFQPYFTATAANVGYGWWSHDIGGHFNGIQEAELYARWVQFGLFSPILRLHSTNDPFLERRPWGYDAETFRVTRDAMQLRHALVPYLYTQSWRNYRHGIPTVRPMYHLHPQLEQAYACPNQYAFGSELIAAPFVTRRDEDTRLSRQVVWLPEGDWFGFFDGEYYPGDAHYAIYGSLEDIPLFARAGAIVPLGPLSSENGTENPDSLTVHIFPGADNRFDLYEDDGETTGYLRDAYAITPFRLEWQGNQLRFTIEPVQGQAQFTPAVREYHLIFHNLQEPEQVEVVIDGATPLCYPVYEPKSGSVILEGLYLHPDKRLEIRMGISGSTLANTHRDVSAPVEKLLASFCLGNKARWTIAEQREAWIADPARLAAYQATLTRSQMRALLEVVTGSGAEHITTAGEELLFLWNNHQDDQLTYLVACEKKGFPRPDEHFKLNQGQVPRFKAIRPAQEFTGYTALLQVDFSHLLRLIYTWNTAGPYPRPHPGMV
jgi:alpha-glucosidase (family GH31 glycosyl hydrolase)